MSYKFRYINKKKDFIIYGSDNLNILNDYLKNKAVFNFSPTKNVIYFNFFILSNFIKIYLKIRKIKSSYLIALISYISPKIVFTLIDNDPNFWRAAKYLYNNMRFIAFQNGARYDLLKNPYKNEIFIPEYVCFGQHDKEFMNLLKCDIKKFYIYGSIKEVLFRNRSQIYKEFKNKTLQKEYDICVIADNFDGWNKVYPKIENRAALIAEYAMRFAQENDFKIVFAFKRNKNFKNARITEKEFYEQYFKFDYKNTFYSYRDSEWKSYETICKSEITIGLSTTLLIESASRGNKVLICDFYDKSFSLGAKEPLSYSTLMPKYHEFCRRVSNILKISDNDYFKERENEVRRLMNISDPITVDEIINKVVESK